MSLPDNKKTLTRDDVNQGIANSINYLSGKAYMQEEKDLNVFSRDTKEIMQELVELKKKFETEQEVIDKLRESALTKAKMITWLSSSIVVGQFVFIMTGTFHYLSWDIMEPISYLMMLGNFTAGFGFYMLNRKDLELQNITEILVNKFTKSSAAR